MMALAPPFSLIAELLRAKAVGASLTLVMLMVNASA